jgi:hypothetical protein
MSHKDFTAQHRAIGRFAAWAAFLVGQAYAVAALLGFLSLESPQDAIGDPFLSVMALLIVVLAPFMIATMIAVHAYAPTQFKVYSLTALAFMILAAAITSSVNFAILVASSQVEAPAPPWLSMFLPYKWPAMAYSLDILAWDWFFALSMLLAAVVFGRGRLEKVVRILMIVSGVLSLAGLMGVPLAGTQALGIGILGYGVAAPVVFALLAILFGRTKPVLGEPDPTRGVSSGA